jgi:hypothetical protein
LRSKKSLYFLKVGVRPSIALVDLRPLVYCHFKPHVLEQQIVLALRGTLNNV